MQTIIQNILNLLKTRSTYGIGSETSDPKLFKQFIEDIGPDTFSRTLDFPIEKIKSGVYTGNWADCPWIAFLSKNTTDIKIGYYLVYLFAGDGSCVYLSLNQGSEKFSKTLLEKRASDLKILTEQVPDVSREKINLHQVTGAERPRKYEAGNVISKVYYDGSIPSNEELKKDFKYMFNILESIENTGFKLYPIEPQTLFLRVSNSELTMLKDMAEKLENRFYLEISSEYKEIEEIIEKQVFLEVPCYIVFYYEKQLWTARLLGVIKDATSISSKDVVSIGRKSSIPYYIQISLFRKIHEEFSNKLFMPRAKTSKAETLAVSVKKKNILFPYERYDFLIEMQRKTNIEMDLIKEMKETLEKNKQIILAGPPGTGKTLVAEEIGRVIAGVTNVKVIQFHPSYTYEDFIEGLRPEPKGIGLTFKPHPGVLMKWAKEASEHPRENYVLIIDEMNRANLPKVFGELLYLLEYRDRKIDLQYSSNFELPNNLYIIGTMNTADRNIRVIDHALRRRFEIFEIGADSELLRKFYDMPENSNDVSNLIDGFIELNKLIRNEINRHHEVGHSYFMKENFTRKELQSIWNRKVFPLLEEYFFDLKEDELQKKFYLDKFWPEVVISGTGRDDEEEA